MIAIGCIIATIAVTPTFTYGGKSCEGPVVEFTITVNPTAQVVDPADLVLEQGGKKIFQELEQQTENYSKIIKIRKYVAYAKNEIS